MNFGAIITTCIIGLAVGAIAKLLLPGKDPGGCFITILLGLAGAWIGSFFGQMLFHDQNYVAGWITSIVGAMILLLIYRVIFGRRS